MDFLLCPVRASTHWWEAPFQARTGGLRMAIGDTWPPWTPSLVVLIWKKQQQHQLWEHHGPVLHLCKWHVFVSKKKSWFCADLVILCLSKKAHTLSFYKHSCYINSSAYCLQCQSMRGSTQDVNPAKNRQVPICHGSATAQMSLEDVVMMQSDPCLHSGCSYTELCNDGVAHLMPLPLPSLASP